MSSPSESFPGYDQLVAEALETPFEGWDFGVFKGRFTQGQPSWSYRDMVLPHLRSATSPLDLGTGGGEFLSSLGPLPPGTVATEGYPPNVPVARRRLQPLGVQVFDTSADQSRLPFADASFDLVLSRHEAYVPSEIRRLLTPGGVFITQQVGGADLADLNAVLEGPPHTYRDLSLDFAAEELESAGLRIVQRREEMIPAAFHDVGAVVLFLRITPWQIPGFDVDTYGERLRRLHASLATGTPLPVSCHRFLIAATVG